MDIDRESRSGRRWRGLLFRLGLLHAWLEPGGRGRTFSCQKRDWRGRGRGGTVPFEIQESVTT
jgi:hypothetical protein